MFEDMAENEIEARIIADPYFQQAMRIGRPRKGHAEGNLGAHVQHILAAIDLLGTQEMRAPLRFAALLHDAGKFALLEGISGYRPERLAPDHLAMLLDTSRRFRNEFQYPVSSADRFIPEHALYSWSFAKRFTKDPGLLDLIKYHDTGWKLFNIRHAPEYHPDLLRSYYSGKDAALYATFSYIDAANRSKEIPLWLQQEF